MSALRLYNEWLTIRGTPLGIPGTSEVGLNRADALRAIELIEVDNGTILGGDVYVQEGKAINPAYANWYVEQGSDEPPALVAARSHREAKRYISNYPETGAGIPLFVLVVEEPTESHS